MPSKDVFIPKRSMPANGLDIKTLMSRKPTKGEVGIEIEIEGKKLPNVGGDTGVSPPWIYSIDHSLRGDENAEYVLKNPIMFDKVPAAVGDLWKCFKTNKSKLDDSNRTSVHVHVNTQDWYLNRVVAFLALYYIVEIPLTEWCGEHRVGNLFCLRAIDAPAQVSNIKKFIKSNGETQLAEVLHYSAMNVNALKKYGSLEIRTLRGCKDQQVIIDWVAIIERLYRLSESFSDPRMICTNLSSIGPLAFFDEILGDKAFLVRSSCGMTDNQIAESVYEGVRIAQDLCYCMDWDMYKPMKIKTDPFGRDQKRVAKKLVGATQGNGIYVEMGAGSIPPGFQTYGAISSAQFTPEQFIQDEDEDEEASMPWGPDEYLENEEEE